MKVTLHFLVTPAVYQSTSQAPQAVGLHLSTSMRAVSYHGSFVWVVD